MSLISCQEIAKSFSSRELFSKLSLGVFQNDRIGLIGPNGSGKSTLLKIMANIEKPDTGQVVRKRDLRIGYVPQIPKCLGQTVEEALLAVMVEEDYTRVRHVLGLLGFSDPTQKCTELSGGWQRRLSMAEALVNEPEILLLDEPTNHLDLEGILWLENFLERSSIPFVVISHDRLFLDTVCDSIWEISHKYPGGLFAADGGYQEFLEKRELFLKGQLTEEKGLASKMRREEEWLKQGAKARTTKSRSRILEAARLKHELGKVKLRNIEKKVEFTLGDTKSQTKKLLAAKNISKDPLFSQVDLLLVRGDRIGIVGDNGSGKSTLLKVLAGELASDSGTVKRADNIVVTLFDQQREKLDLELPLRRGLAPDGDTIYFQGKSIHVNSFCEKFLFTKDRLDLPMKQLSGGERARVLIANLMTKPADLLLLDEPTNDLDIDTLEILEESLELFPGAVILVTHDRALMDRVADKVFSFQDKLFFNEVGQWLNHKKQKAIAKESLEIKPKAPAAKKKGLGFKEKHELSQLEKKIESLEESLNHLSKELEKKLDSATYQKLCIDLSNAQKALETALARWEELIALDI